MTELTKGQWTTLSLRRQVAQRLKRFKEAQGCKSLGEAIDHAIDLAYMYLEMSKLVVNREMVNKHE